VKRIWLVLAGVLLAGCGVQPSGVTDAGEAPTGVAPGVTLYFVDAQGTLSPRLRPTDRLGTIAEAMTLLLWGPGGPDLRTEIASTDQKRVVVTTAPGVIHLDVPLATYEVTPLGIDQIVCTALGVHVQSGGSPSTTVQVRFTLSTPESDKRRTCPLITAR
jgi:hypothetical protein